MGFGVFFLDSKKKQHFGGFVFLWLRFQKNKRKNGSTLDGFCHESHMFFFEMMGQKWKKGSKRLLKNRGSFQKSDGTIWQKET